MTLTNPDGLTFTQYLDRQFALRLRAADIYAETTDQRRCDGGRDCPNDWPGWVDAHTGDALCDGHAAMRATDRGSRFAEEETDIGCRYCQSGDHFDDDCPAFA